MQYQTDLPDNLPELPFTIGAIGYFSYDVGRRLEKIPVIAEDDIDLPNTCIGFLRLEHCCRSLSEKDLVNHIKC